MPESTDAVEPTKTAPTMKSRLGVYRIVLKRLRRRTVLGVGALLAADCVAGAALSVAIKGIVDAGTNGRGSAIAIAVVVAGLAAGFTSVAGRVLSDAETMLANQAGLDVHGDILDLASSSPGLELVEDSDHLDLISLVRTSGDDLLRSLFSIGMAMSLIGRLLVAVVLLGAVNPVLILLPLFAVPSALLVRRSNRHVAEAGLISAERLRSSSQLHGLFLRPGPAMELRVFGCAGAMDDRSDHLWNEVGWIAFRGAMRSALVSSGGWIAQSIGAGLALFVVVRDVAGGTASIGDVVLVASLTLQLRVNVMDSVAAVRKAALGVTTTDRFIELQDRAASNRGRYEGSLHAPRSLGRGIRLDGVSFAYERGGPPVLHDVSFDLPAGSTVAIVGENGAGKTTLVKLLSRLYLPTQGKITVDGIDLRDIDSSDWARNVSAGFQDFLRLEATLRDSVGVGATDGIGTDVEIVAALDAADSARLLEQIEGGLDAELGSTYRQGAELSGGQWQRIAIARAMMRRSPLLLVLDEPTSALDPAAEHALYERYASAAHAASTNGGITVLVSHRFSSVGMADVIVVLEGGEVVELGSHETLVEAGGVYAAMYRQQAEAYL